MGVTPSSDTLGTCSPYILKNVPLLGDTRFHVMVSVHEIRSGIRPTVLLDIARVGSHVHRPRLWWMNLLPREVLRRAYTSRKWPFCNWSLQLIFSYK
jgi:hypothetical protein